MSEKNHPSSLEWYSGHGLPLNDSVLSLSPFTSLSSSHHCPQPNPINAAACWFQDLSIVQQAALVPHFPQLNFIATEGSLPDYVYLGANYSKIIMIREPLSRTLSAFHWWTFVSNKVGPVPNEDGVGVRVSRVRRGGAARRGAAEKLLSDIFFSALCYPAVLRIKSTSQSLCIVLVNNATGSYRLLGIKVKHTVLIPP